MPARYYAVLVFCPIYCQANIHIYVHIYVGIYIYIYIILFIVPGLPLNDNYMYPHQCQHGAPHPALLSDGTELAIHSTPRYSYTGDKPVLY